MKAIRLKRLVTVLAVLAAVSTAQGALAEPYEMSVILDRAHGDLVRQGDYDSAIVQIAQGDHRLPFASNTNLCVAQTKTDDFKQAALSCDMAVQLAEFAAENGHRKDIDYTTEWAIALSNRGVLRAMTGDEAGAERDFRAAVALDSRSDIPDQNLFHLLNGDAAGLAKN